MWVVPDESGADPGYQQLEIDDELLAGGSVTIASACPGIVGEAASPSATTCRLKGARLATGRPPNLPQAPYLHLFVARGG